MTDFFLVHDTVRVVGSNGNDGYYTVSSTTYNGSTSDIVVLEDVDVNSGTGNIYCEDTLTVDGNILWKYYSATDVLFNYKWNNYIKISNDISIS